MYGLNFTIVTYIYVRVCVYTCVCVVFIHMCVHKHVRVHVNFTGVSPFT